MPWLSHTRKKGKPFTGGLSVIVLNCCQWMILPWVQPYVQWVTTVLLSTLLKIYQYLLSKIITTREEKIIFQNSFVKFKVIFMMSQVHV